MGLGRKFFQTRYFERKPHLVDEVTLRCGKYIKRIKKKKKEAE